MNTSEMYAVYQYDNVVFGLKKGKTFDQIKPCCYCATASDAAYATGELICESFSVKPGQSLEEFWAKYLKRQDED